jgi:hypothetical protein
MQVLQPLRAPLTTFTVPSWLVEMPDEESASDSSSTSDVTISSSDVLGAVMGLSLALVDLTGHHGNFTLNNLIATFIATDVLQLIGVRSFRTAGVLLLGTCPSFLEVVMAWLCMPALASVLQDA